MGTSVEGGSRVGEKAPRGPEAPAAPEQVLEAKLPRKVLVKEGRVPKAPDVIENPIEKGPESAGPKIESLTLNLPAAPILGRHAAPRAAVIAQSPAEEGPPPKTLITEEGAVSTPMLEENNRDTKPDASPPSLKPAPLETPKDAQLSAASSPRSPKMLPPLPTRVADETLPGKPTRETNIPQVAVNGPAPESLPESARVEAAATAREEKRIAVAEPRAPAVIAPRTEETQQSRPADDATDKSAAIPGTSQSSPGPTAAHDSPPPLASSRAPRETTARPDDAPQHKIAQRETGDTPEASPVSAGGTNPRETNATPEGPVAHPPAPQPPTREDAPRPDRSIDSESAPQPPREHPVTRETIKSPAPEETDSSSSHTVAPLSIPPRGEPTAPDVPPSTAESPLETLPEIEPSPLDPSGPITDATRAYLDATAPVIEELSLLMTRIPALTLDDFDVSRGGLSIVPKDIVVKMEAVKRDLQVLDSRTFSIVPPKDFARFHARIRESITETFRACESAVNFFTERNAEDLKRVYEHVGRAGTLLEKSMARAQ
jgi:hypothetical protein